MANRLDRGGSMSDYLSQISKPKVKPPIISIVGYPGAGKEQPISSIVICPSGEKKIGDIIVGDQVVGMDGLPKNVTGVYPQGMKDVYEITFSDGFSAKCGKDHLWTVINKRGKASTVSLRDIISSYRYKCGQSRYKIPLCEPVNFTERKTSFDPYLIGVLIGDGYLCGESVSVSVANIDNFIFEKIKKTLGNYTISERSTGLNVKQYNIKSGRNNELKKHIKEIGLNVKSHEKFIPNMYKYASIEDREALLNGLMDTDGCCSKNRTSYSTKSEILADDICWLIQSLGGAAIKHMYDRTHHNKGIEYSVNVKTFKNPFTLPRKAQEWTLNAKVRMCRFIKDIRMLNYKEESVCIKVDAVDELYLTDNFIVTHNTSLAAMFPAPIFIQTDDNSETVFQSWPEDLQPAFMPKIPRANAKKSVRPSDVVLDQLRELASKQHDFKTVVFDTSTSLNLLIEEEVTIFDPSKSGEP